MRKLLITFICVLLTSPLAAFHTGLPIEGFEYGTIELDNINLDAYSESIVLSTEELILNVGDLVYIKIGHRVGSHPYGYDYARPIFMDIDDYSRNEVGGRGSIFV